MRLQKVSGSVGLQSSLLKWSSVDEQYGEYAIGKMLKSRNFFEKALDLGAGTGRDLEIIRQHSPNSELYGIEFNAKQCALLESKGVKTFQVDLENTRLPFENETFDIVIINQVLEHIKDIFFVLHETTRVLKKDGCVLIGVPNVASFHNRALLLFGRHPTQAKAYSAHVRTFSKKDTQIMIELAGNGALQLVGFAGSQFYPFPKSMARALCSVFPSLAFSIFFLYQKKGKYTDSFYRYGQSLTASTFCTNELVAAK